MLTSNSVTEKCVLCIIWYREWCEIHNSKVSKKWEELVDVDIKRGGGGVRAFQTTGALRQVCLIYGLLIIQFFVCLFSDHRVCSWRGFRCLFEGKRKILSAKCSHHFLWSKYQHGRPKENIF